MVRSAGRPKTRYEVTCEQCGKRFETTPYLAARGGGRFCARDCYAASRVGIPRVLKRQTLAVKSCEACGTEFTVGYGTRRPHVQRLCSPQCQRASRYRHGYRANEITPMDAAYLAGFIDGEGSIMLIAHRDVAALRISAANTYLPVLEWIVQVTGVGKVHTTAPVKDVHKPGGQWWCNAEAAEGVIRQIRPYLKIKAVQADLALETQERLRDPALKADRSWQAEYIERMRAMNRRGPLPDMTASSGG